LNQFEYLRVLGFRVLVVIANFSFPIYSNFVIEMLFMKQRIDHFLTRRNLPRGDSILATTQTFTGLQYLLFNSRRRRRRRTATTLINNVSWQSNSGRGSIREMGARQSSASSTDYDINNTISKSSSSKSSSSSSHHHACDKCRGEGVLITQSRRQRQERKRFEKALLYEKPILLIGENGSSSRSRTSRENAGDERRSENKKQKIGSSSNKQKQSGEKKQTCAECHGTGLLKSSTNDNNFNACERSEGHVAIVGGGIGGMALAVALQHRGIRFTIFEKDLEFNERRQGYGLTMQRYSGASALKQLGLELKGVGSDANVALRYDGVVLGKYGHSVEQRKELENNNDNENNKTNSKHLPSVAHSLRNVHIPRQELRKMLLDAVDPKNIRWGAKFESARTLLNDNSYKEKEQKEEQNNINDDPRIEVTFDNGEKVITDCIVGADGLFSRVRAHKFDNADAVHEGLNYLDCLVVLGICHGMDHELCKNKAFQIMDGTNRLFCMPFSTNEIAEDILGYKNDIDPAYENIPHAMMWQLSFPCEYDEAVELSKDREKLLKESRKRCENWCEPASTLLKSTRSVNMSGYPAFDMLIEDEILFRNGRKKNSTCESDKASAAALNAVTTLLGDAAHPMSPFKGQGANQALVDALHLARALSRAPKFLLPGERTNGTPPKVANTEEALIIAEEAMLKRSRGKVEGSRVAAKYLHSEAALAEGDFVRANVAISAALGEVYDGRNG
jgi:salicylate hydroxylase